MKEDLVKEVWSDVKRMVIEYSIISFVVGVIVGAILF